MGWLKLLVQQRLLAAAMPFLMAILSRAGFEGPATALSELVQAAIVFVPSALSLTSYFGILKSDRLLLQKRLLAAFLPTAAVLLKQLGVVIPDDVLASTTTQGGLLFAALLNVLSFFTGNQQGAVGKGAFLPAPG